MSTPVTLFTGKPGAGKTAQLVAEIIRLREAEPGRPLFQMGINGLKEGIAADLTMEQLATWWELPPGSILVIDECQEPHLMPKDRGNPPEWVQRISKVRHYGMSFLLTTQAPENMSAYVRRLVGRHVHTVNKFQTGVLQKFEWGRCYDDPETRTARKQAIESMGTLPKEVFDLYKSSQLHTVKARVPKKFYLFIVMVVLSIGGLVAVPLVMKHMRDTAVTAAKGGQVKPADNTRAFSAADQSLRRADYAAWMRPRVAGIPWTAPAFDHLEVKSVPRLACMQLQTGECNCVTEQGTKVDIPLATCHAIVQDGLYNPFVGDPDASKREQQAAPGGRRGTADPAASPAPPAAVAGASDNPHGQRSTAVAYIPPTYGPREPDEPLHFQN
jgi:Zonula occludens toxin